LQPTVEAQTDHVAEGLLMPGQLGPLEASYLPLLNPGDAGAAGGEAPIQMDNRPACDAFQQSDRLTGVSRCKWLHNKEFLIQSQGCAMRIDLTAPTPLLTAGLAGISGRIKFIPEDFDVEETPPYVLGSGYTPDPKLPASAQPSSETLTRLVEGAWLQRLLPGSKLIFSAGYFDQPEETAKIISS
jgi:hypothetical protein